MEFNLENKRAKNRCETILEDALYLFLKKGYANTSLNDIVEKSGGSLATIYKYFENKEGLFKAIVLKAISKFKDDLEKNISVSSNLNLEEFLFKFSELYLTLILSPKSIALHRLILSEGFNMENHNIGKLFADECSKFLNEYLIDFLKSCKKTENLSVEDISKFVNIYLFAIKEPFFYSSLINSKEVKLTQTDKKAHIDKTIKMLLYGFLG